MLMRYWYEYWPLEVAFYHEFDFGLFLSVVPKGFGL